MKTSAIEDILPLTPLQEGLLFHTLSEESDAEVYNTQLLLELRGPLDAGRLRGAAEALLLRHPNLRAAFRQRKNGEPIQVIQRNVPLPWSEVDLGRHPAAEAERLLSELLATDRVARFELATAPRCGSPCCGSGGRPPAGHDGASHPDRRLVRAAAPAGAADAVRRPRGRFRAAPGHPLPGLPRLAEPPGPGGDQGRLATGTGGASGPEPGGRPRPGPARGAARPAGGGPPGAADR
ncbi:hypothetical protein GXW82_09410 [Streptacidiphilus sp. 4-A2]|nr:hypothetical protein [Streptacidiphilus sp. 4-A2]